MPYDVITTAGPRITVLSKDESDSGVPGGDVKWANIKDKPATFPPTIGTTATTAKAGNYNPAWSDITNKPIIPPAQIQSDWNQSDNSKLDFIKNKPAISAPTWDSVTGKPATFPPTIGTTETTAKAGNYNPTWADITNKPVIPAAQIQSDWNQSDNSKLDFIKNKPAISGTQIQSDWNQSDNSKLDFIKNKPTIPPAYTLPVATLSTLGGVKQAAAVPDLSDGADTVDEINKLLANLRNAGIIAK